MQRCALFLTLLNVIHNLVVLRFTVVRTLIGLLTKVITDSYLFHLVRVCTQEFIIDVLMHVYPCTGMACLPIVHVDTPNRPVDCPIEICVREDDVWTLATKFQCDFLQIGTGCRLQDRASSSCGPGECNLDDKGMD